MAVSHTLSTIHLAIVCPIGDEGEQAVRFIREVFQYSDAAGRVTFLAVTDRVTPEQTREELKKYACQEPRLVVVWAPEDRCVVDAYMRGYREALACGADWILEIDAGFSHQPKDIPRFFPFMLAGYDCVFGSRFMKGGHIRDSSWKRRTVSWGGTVLTNLLIGTRLKDMTSGFEMFTRETLAMVLAKGIHSRAHFFQTEIKIHCRNLKLAEVPIEYRSASPGLKGGPVTEAFTQLWRLFKLRLAGKLDDLSVEIHGEADEHHSNFDRGAKRSAAKPGSRVC